MSGGVIYSELEVDTCHWLQELIRSGQIPDGDVLAGDFRDWPLETWDADQIHWFAGIGGWARAAMEAGWPRAWTLWTASLPCQPFSNAGKKKGFQDDRHLWPAFFKSVQVGRPFAIIGEQVSNKDGLGWLDRVFDDLEREGYSCGATDSRAKCFGAPHRRSRLYWFAVTLSDTDSDGCGAGSGNDQAARYGTAAASDCELSGLSDTDGIGLQGSRQVGRSSHSEEGSDRQKHRTVNDGWFNFWSDREWLSFRLGKKRPTKPGLRVLANGIPPNLAKLSLRGYGNAIVLPQATAFVRTVMTIIEDLQQ